ncbi:unnamed protein product [Chrysodeixis includens]|uniref:Chitin-binding type-2 domain-containing protein n=1 Tax=Chrysodeixis includens TaxID=689277 RepID=A0A9N8KY04_CHRIL|nr:unnamed protein product [Chrysodeixis includens]
MAKKCAGLLLAKPPECFSVSFCRGPRESFRYLAQAPTGELFLKGASTLTWSQLSPALIKRRAEAPRKPSLPLPSTVDCPETTAVGLVYSTPYIKINGDDYFRDPSGAWPGVGCPAPPGELAVVVTIATLIKACARAPGHSPRARASAPYAHGVLLRSLLSGATGTLSQTTAKKDSITIHLVLLASVIAQNGYDYNRPNRPFGQGPSSNRPGTSPGSGSTTPSYSIRPQSDDYNGNGGPTTGYPTGSQNYPNSGNQRPGYPGSSYPGQGPSGPSGGYPGQSDNSYNQGRGPSRYPGQGSRYPGQGQNYPGQPGSNYGTTSFADSDTGSYEGGDYSAIPGEPEIDYPVLSYIPQTSFNCKSQQLPGYYADVESRCQVFHVCSNNRTYDFLCPNGTIFSQEDFVCVWWNQFTCESAPGLYQLNAKLYDYSKTGSQSNQDYPSSFNDYSGSSYPGNRGPQGPSSYPGSGTSRPSSYPGSSGPTTPYPSVTLTSSYPGSSSGGYPSSQGPSGNYPGSGSSDGYPGSQNSGNYPNYQGPGSYPSGPQGPSTGPGSTGSGYPGSGPSTSYPGSSPGSQGYPSGRPSGPGYQNGNRGRPAQKPNREYLPPRN